MIYRFEDCALDVERRELRRGGVLCPVEPQVFDLLHFLIANRQRVVSRDEIYKSVWHGRIVSESVLGNRINAARKAIGDDGAQQRLIRTARRVGFRFVGTVSEQPEPSAGSQTSEHIGARRGKPSLLVLPMATAAADDELACCLTGIADDLTAALARSRSFAVVAHNRVCRGGDDFGQIAREFAVGYVIVCGLHRAGDQTRLTVRLIDARADVHIWARSYTCASGARLDDLDNIVANIAAAAEPCIYAKEASRHRQEPLQALDAADCVLMALSIARIRARQNYAIADRLLARALEIDPYCQRAHSILAWYAGMYVLWGWKPRQATIHFALDTARKAVLLDEHDPWAHFALGWALAQNRCPEEGIEEYRKAISLNPCFPHTYYSLGTALAYVGQTETALATVDEGERLGAPEIFPGHANSSRAGIYFCAEKYDCAMKAAQRSVAQSPGLVASQRHLFVAHALSGEMEEARTAFTTFHRLVPNVSLESTTDAMPLIRDNDLNRMLDAFRLMGVR